ncbi:arginine--tRNA ligase [Candidatus Woesebacteria bacterium]|nr:arginine--tRNA ligase [Candidatus Woesebacteria bacterium]
MAKPFTIGHLRSTIIGDAVANLLEATGWTVKRDNHLGDWGTQFGKQICAIKKWGDEEEIAQSERPVKKLVELYVKFHAEAEENPELVDEGRAWFKKLEDGDLEARRLWQKCIDWSWKEFNQIYEELGVRFTENDGRGYGESYFEDKMDVVVEELETKNLLTDSEGARLVFFPDDQYPPLMVIKKDGTTLYATRDLATDKFRLQKYGADVRIINEVGAEQSLYFQQIFAIELMLGWVEPDQRVHVKHGMFRFKDGKMSTRKGNVIWLEDVLQEARERAQQLGDDPEHAQTIASAVGIGALKWNDLKRSAHLDVVFDWDEMLSMEGNSGPYMQYTVVRGKSVLQKWQESGFTATATTEADITPEGLEILRLLSRYGEAVERAAQEYAPHLLANALFEIAQSFNTFYNKHQIVADGVPQVRIDLVNATVAVLSHGLGLLGIETVDRM